MEPVVVVFLVISLKVIKRSFLCKHVFFFIISRVSQYKFQKFALLLFLPFWSFSLEPLTN